MRRKIKDLYVHSSLAAKIRVSYLILLIPVTAFVVFAFLYLWQGNQRYSDMLESVVTASEFSLDFKKDYDYETYLLIVENKTLEESKLNDLLGEAGRVVASLEAMTDGEDNRERLRGVKKYLENLKTYQSRIEVNLREGNRYDDNIEIWENDVQIVTALIQDTVSQYIYYEIKDLEQSKAEFEHVYMGMLQVIIIIFLLIVAVIAVLSYMIPRSISRPIRTLSQVTEQVARGDLTVRSDIQAGEEVTALSDSMNTMIDKINELLDQVKEEQIHLRKAEFQLLQSQINPHFLYNTLDAIIWLAEGGHQKQVVQMVGSLSEFFRTSLNQGKDIITVREEMQHARSYLEIQQMRYQDILRYEIVVAEELMDCLIPKITIQPLVENALYHGIKNKRGLGTIQISGIREGNLAVLQVNDDGIGMEEERLARVREGIRNHAPTDSGIYGLYNVNERIRLNFGEAYGITIDSTYGKGTSIRICLPWSEND